jgi:hypothetical protein
MTSGCSVKSCQALVPVSTIRSSVPLAVTMLTLKSDTTNSLDAERAGYGPASIADPTEISPAEIRVTASQVGQ